jgi:hypothetical protein
MAILVLLLREVRIRWLQRDGHHKQAQGCASASVYVMIWEVKSKTEHHIEQPQNANSERACIWGPLFDASIQIERQGSI